MGTVIGEEVHFIVQRHIVDAQSAFLGEGLASVTYPFVALGYWAFDYTMSKESRRIESRLGVGVR